MQMHEIISDQQPQAQAQYNPYAILEISTKASKAEVTRTYRRLASRWHPDRFALAEKQRATLKFIAIRLAYEEIMRRLGAPPRKAECFTPNQTLLPQHWYQDFPWLAISTMSLAAILYVYLPPISGGVLLVIFYMLSRYLYKEPLFHPVAFLCKDFFLSVLSYLIFIVLIINLITIAACNILQKHDFAVTRLLC